LQKLKKHLNGTKKRTVIACGDFENDTEMLKAADVAVAPENALDSVKEVADLVLCHCQEGLIADVIERIERGEIPHA
jgi:hydroxymethylpyrimidine pyrophosphatase-like HAD family hydrolase